MIVKINLIQRRENQLNADSKNLFPCDYCRFLLLFSTSLTSFSPLLCCNAHVLHLLLVFWIIFGVARFEKHVCFYCYFGFFIYAPGVKYLYCDYFIHVFFLASSFSPFINVVIVLLVFVLICYSVLSCFVSDTLS